VRSLVAQGAEQRCSKSKTSKFTSDPARRCTQHFRLCCRSQGPASLRTYISVQPALRAQLHMRFSLLTNSSDSALLSCRVRRWHPRGNRGPAQLRPGGGRPHQGAAPRPCLQSRQRAAHPPRAVCRWSTRASRLGRATARRSTARRRRCLARTGFREGLSRARRYSSPGLLAVVLVCLALAALSTVSRGMVASGPAPAGARQAHCPALAAAVGCLLCYAVPCPPCHGPSAGHSVRCCCDRSTAEPGQTPHVIPRP